MATRFSGQPPGSSSGMDSLVGANDRVLSPLATTHQHADRATAINLGQHRLELPHIGHLHIGQRQDHVTGTQPGGFCRPIHVLNTHTCRDLELTLLLNREVNQRQPQRSGAHGGGLLGH